MKLKHTIYFFLPTIIIAVVGWTLVDRNTPSQAVLESIFNKGKLNIPVYELYDVGVADINSDGNYDLFSINHSARQVVLLNKGNGEFEDRIDQIGLGQDLEYKNIENRGTDPLFELPGLYIYRKDKKLHLKSVNTSNKVSGELSFPWPLEVEGSKGAIFSLDSSDRYSSEVSDSRLSFSFEGDGEIVVVGIQDILELEHVFTLNSNVALDSVFLGSSLVNPNQHEFVLEWRDRHAMSWADVNGDGELDVFIARGGVKGQLNNIPTKVSDRLMTSTNGVFSQGSEVSEFEKYGCPARQTAWVDYDNDGLLDIYISCGRNRIPGFNNLLLRQEVNGGFKNTSIVAGLAFDKISVFRWFDSDRDGDMDLLSIDDSELVHYINNEGVFEKSVLFDNLKTDFVQIQVSDFDGDGDFDAYAVSRSESKLIINNDGVLSAFDPSSFGLPKGGRSAEWIDFDNDGVIDLHAVPGGLFVQTQAGKFKQSGLLDTGEDIFKISQSRCNWFDIDNSGSIDAVCATQRNYAKELRVVKKLLDNNAITRYWNVDSFTNSGNTNNWLHVDLLGSKGNRQAIGAVVEIVAGDSVQIRPTGATDGAHYSQGNYRNYFGLGDIDSIEILRVYWPDGEITEQSNVDVNRLLEIRKLGAR